MSVKIAGHTAALIKASAGSRRGRIPGFTGRPLAASPASLRLQAKAAAAKAAVAASGGRKRGKVVPPPELGYIPQNKPSSAFFWDEATLAYSEKLLQNPNYPPPLPKFTSHENQHIAKVSSRFWWIFIEAY